MLAPLRVRVPTSSPPQSPIPQGGRGRSSWLTLFRDGWESGSGGCGRVPCTGPARTTLIPFAAATWERGFYSRQALGRRVGAEPRSPVRHSKPLGRHTLTFGNVLICANVTRGYIPPSQSAACRPDLLAVTHPSQRSGRLLWLVRQTSVRLHTARHSGCAVRRSRPLVLLTHCDQGSGPVKSPSREPWCAVRGEGVRRLSNLSFGQQDTE